MQHKILTIGITGLAVVTLVVGIFVIGGSPLSPIKPAQAAAQELIDRSIDRIIKLSPEEQKDLEKKLNADLESSLQEARNAKDLEIVPENEIERFQMPTPGKERKMISTTFKKKAPIQNGDQPSLEEPTETVQRVIIKRTDQGESTDESTTVIDNPGPHVHFDGGKIPAPIGVTVLRYTNSEGGLVQLGIDKDDKPVFKLIKLDKEHKDGNKESNVLFLQKKDG